MFDSRIKDRRFKPKWDPYLKKKMNITLTPEEVKALYAYIYGGDATPEEYQLGAEVHGRVFGMVEQEIDARIIKNLDDVWKDAYK